MWNGSKVLMALGLLIAVAGCSQDRPADYARQRPSVDSLHPDDRGLQSKDVRAASSNLARDLLAHPELARSEHQWTVVVDRFEDRTMDRYFAPNYDIFIERLRTELAKNGYGRVTLIENRARLGNLRSRELDGPTEIARLQPDFALYGKAYDMPNRATNYYMLEFVLTNLKTGVQVWANQYEVKVAR